MFPSIRFALFAWFPLCCLLACKNTPKADTGPLVVTTTAMIRDGLEPLIKDYAKIQVLMGPGSDPHSYRPVPGDLSALENAHALVFNGFYLEGNMTSMLESSHVQAFSVRLSDALAPQAAIPADGYHFDPHFWFDPMLWMQCMFHAADQLAPQLNIPQDTLQVRKERFKQFCLSLDQEVWCRIETIPAHRRVLLTVHDAFTYFGRRYGLEVKSLQGVSTAAEFGVFEVQDMVDYVVQQNIPAVFTETGQSRRSMEAVVRGCAAQGHQLIQGATLYADAPGPKGSLADTWSRMLKINALHLAESLAGNP